MYIFQNALQNLIRNKSRNILLSAIVFTIIATTAVTLIINNTANGIIEDYQVRFGSRVNIVPDTAQMMGNLGYIMTYGRPQVTAQQSIAFAQLPYVRSYEMTAFQPAFSDTLITVDGDADLEIGGGMGGLFGGGGMGQIGDAVTGGRGGNLDLEEMDMPNLRLYGNNWDDFQLGLRDLVEGRFPTAYSEAMISIELADLNGLTPGDTIRIYSPAVIGEGEDIAMQQAARDLTIVGIYFDMTPESAAGGFIRASFLNRRNEVLTTLDTVIGTMGEGDSSVTIAAVYYLHEPDMLPYFEAELRSLGLSPLLLVTTNEAEYLAIVQPVMGLRDVTSTFMIIVLVLGGIVLVFIASMSVRERKYEIGVLRAMGMKKRKVALGLMTEMLAITIVCLSLGLTVGTIVAQPISDTLLAAQIENITPGETVDSGFMGGMFGGNMGGRFAQMMGASSQTAEPLSELDVSLGARTVAEIIGVSLLLATLAGGVSILRITKYEPMKILMERN